jgi:hypothetical protein
MAAAWEQAPIYQPGAGTPPAASSGPARGIPQPGGGAGWQSAPSAEDAVRQMTREQMVDYYRTSKRGDPLADAIERELSKPMEGESPEDTDRRLYGHMDPQLSPLDSMIIGGGDMATMGGGDELTGAVSGIGSMMRGEGYMPGYEKGRDQARELLDVSQEENPWSHFAGQVGGGIAQSMLLPQEGLKSLGGRVLTGMGLGGAQGGIYGFLSGEGTEDRLKQGGYGGVVGGTLGGLFPLLGAGAGYLRGRWKDKGLDQKSVGKVADMLEDTGWTPEQAKATAQKQGPLGMMADVNEGMQVATGGTSAAGGASVIAPRLEARRAGAKGRVTGMLDDTFGKYVGPQAVKDGIADMRKPAGPAYELAKRHVVDPEDALLKIDELMKTYSPKSPLGGMLQTYRAQLVDDAGNVIGQGNIVHGVREQLDDQINKLYRAGEGKAAARLQDVRRELDKVLKTQIPGFDEADRLWAEGARIDEAYQYGKDEILGRTHPDQVKAKVSKATKPEEIAMRAGVRDEIEMRMSQPNVNPATKADRILDGNMNSDKLDLFTTPERRARLAQGLDNEQTFMETSNLAEPSRNSRTTPIGQAAARYWGPQGRAGLGDAAIDTMAGAGAGFMLGGPSGALAGGSGAAMGRLREMIAGALQKGPASELINATADRLTRQGPARDKLIEDIIVRSGRKLSKEQAGKAVDQLVRSLTRGLPATGADVYLDAREVNE